MQHRKKSIQAVKAPQRKTRQRKEIRKVWRRNSRPFGRHATNLWAGSGENREGARPLRATGARRIGEVSYKNIVRPSTFQRPPRNETDITQNKKFRQCVIAWPSENSLQRAARRTFAEENKDTRSRLRPEEAVIYSPRFASPTL